jgi:anti-sigma B factor antagonist
MHLHEHQDSGVDVLELEGEIDLHYAPAFRDLLQAKVKSNCPALLLDLSRVSFIDSTGIAAILEYLRAATNSRARFCIGGVTEHVATVFRVVQLDKSMPIYMDAAAARDALVHDHLPAPSQPLFASAA